MVETIDDNFSLIDFGVYSLDRVTEPSDQELAGVATSITDGLKKHGLVLVKNTGYKDHVVDHLWELYNSFRSLPLETRMKYAVIPELGFPINAMIYAPPLKETPVDMLPYHSEGLCAWPLTQSITYPEKEVPGITAALDDLAEFAFKLLYRFLQCLCLGLGYERNLCDKYFEGYLKKGTNASQLRLNYYLPWSKVDDAQKGFFQLSPHQDVGTLTIVKVDRPGLQFCGADGEWIDVPFVPDTYVLQCGTAINQIFGKTLKAPRHRVVFKDEIRDLERRSTACFLVPDSYRPLQCAPGVGIPPKTMDEIVKDHTAGEYY